MFRSVAFSLPLFLFAGQYVAAQQVIQQPLIGASSVNTTVSVPDRGSTFLGGVSSAQAGRVQYGPIRSGTASGLATQASSMSTSVYIHDLHAMDQAILNSAPAASEQNVRVPRVMPRDRRGEPEPESARDATPLEKSAKYEELARQSEKSGKPGVARLHWQMAAKYGSKLAEKRLAELKSRTTPGALARSADR